MSTDPGNSEQTTFADRLVDRELAWWTWPSQLVGHVAPSIGAVVRRDIVLLDRVPYGRWVPFAAAAMLVPFSLLRLGIDEVYTESLFFLLLLVLFSLVAPTLGVLLVVGHAVADVLVSVGDYGLGLGMLGRAVSWALLWLLVVEVPLVGRHVGRWLERRWAEPPLVYIGPVAAGLTVAVLVYVWTLAVAILIRPAFVWGPHFSPTVEAIRPLQESGNLLAWSAGLLTAGIAAAHLRLGTAGTAAVPAASRVRPSTLPASLRLALRWAIALLLLGGIISAVLDVAILLAALVAGYGAARWISRSETLAGAVLTVPYLVRFGIGFVVTLYVGRAIGRVGLSRLGGTAGSEFFPVVLTVALGLVVFSALLGVRAPTVALEPSEEPDPSGEP